MSGKIQTTRAFIDTAATIKNLNETKDYDFLHIASHSIHDSINSFSGFLLYNVNPSVGVYYDQVLENEIAPNSVFLNICYASDYRYVNGEGPINLSRAFLINGTNNVVYTSRKVLDSYARIFAVSFYNNLSFDWQICESIAKTKRQMISDSKFNNPIWWSNIQVISSE